MFMIWSSQFDKQRKKQQIEELESIVRLKKAEADMFQFKSDEARREAEGLQRIVSAKADKVEEEYASRYCCNIQSKAVYLPKFPFQDSCASRTSHILPCHNHQS